MHRETVYYNREVRNKSIGLIFLPQLFFTFYFTGLERVSKQKENAQRHWQSIHDAGHIKQGLAALRHHNAKRKKNESQNCRKKKKCARHLQSCIIVQHKNHIILLDKDCFSKGEAYFLFCFGKRKQQHAVFVYRRCVAQFLALFTFL